MTPARCTLLPWDTEFWGSTIGRVDGSLDRDGLRGVDEWAHERGVSCLYYLVDAGDVPSAQVAGLGGFKFVDIRVELARAAQPVEPAPPVRSGREADIAALRAIARTGHDVTRFYADPRFPDERCDDLYDTWLLRSFEGYAREVLVIDVDERPVGYVSCHADGDTGSIGLIGVHADERRRGLGRALVLGAVDWSARQGLARITVVTQGRNVGAQRVFTSCGFRPSATGLWFHKWYDE